MTRKSMIVVTAILVCKAVVGYSQETVSRSGSFTMIVLPDTQNAVDVTKQKAAGYKIDSADIFLEQMRYIAGRSVNNGGDVAFLASVGDVWQHVSRDMDPDHESRGIVAFANAPAESRSFVNPEGVEGFEIPKAIEGYRLISEAGIPFGVPPGNHDYDAWWTVQIPRSATNRARTQSHVGGLSNFRSAFGSDTEFFRDKDWYVSAFQGGGSSAQIFEAGGYRFLHFAFEMHAGDDVLAWARSVIDDYPGLPTIISTHDFLNARGQRLPGSDMDLALADPEQNNSSEAIWQKFIRQTDQVFLVLSGHLAGQARRIDTNDFGHGVYQILADYQRRGQVAIDAGAEPRGGIGDGWLREMTFHLGDEDSRIAVRTYSPHYGAYANELANYARWYKAGEQPQMTNLQFVVADDYVVSLTDWVERFGAPVLH